MARDLTTIAAIEGEIRKRLKDLRLAIFNKRESLAASEREEAILLENISELETEAQEAFARARAIGKGDEVAALPSVFGGFDSTPIPDAAAPCRHRGIFNDATSATGYRCDECMAEYTPSDSGVTDAFNAATTPQDQSDKTHIFGNGSF